MPKGTKSGDEKSVREAMVRKIRVDIGLLTGESPIEAIEAIIDRIVAAGCQEIERERLLDTIKAQTKTTLSVLRQRLHNVVKQRKNQGRPDNLILNSFSEPLPLEFNAGVVIRQKLDGLFALDEFAQRPMIMRKPPWERRAKTYPRQMIDADDAELLAWVQQQGIHLRGRPAIKTVMSALIEDYTFHPVLDYLDSLKWDGVPRLNRWLIDYLGAPEVENYTTLIGPKWMISAVARIYRPGCMAKYCLLLLGPQDLGKSAALNILGGEWFSDDMAELGTKDSAMQNAGVWIIELAELASTRKADIDTNKAFISRRVDRFRPPYGTHIVERPRHSVLAATVNPSDAFLKDETGNVRFWNVTCTAIDLDALERDRDQLWAEAVHRFKAGETWWLQEEAAIEAAHEEQAAHSQLVEDHAWYPLIAGWLHEKRDVCAPDQIRVSDHSPVFTMEQILAGALEIPRERMNEQRATIQVGKIMRKLGWRSGAVTLASHSQEDERVRRWQREKFVCNRQTPNGTPCGIELEPPYYDCPRHPKES